MGKNRQAGPGREREKERGKERTNPAHDTYVVSESSLEMGIVKVLTILPLLSILTIDPVL